MALLLAEVLPTDTEISTLLDAVVAAATAAGGEFVEAQVTSSRDRVFVIVDGAMEEPLRIALTAAALVVDALAEVRLVGADIEAIKAHRPPSGYLVEWDLPAGLTMDAYLTRKNTKAPLYAQVPEITFQRTYVREDMAKCLCFYDAPDEAAVRRAREVVDAPVNRLHALAELPALTGD